jgi:hypothetical protein
MRAPLVFMLAVTASFFAAPAFAAMAPKEIKDTFFNGQPFTASTPQKVRYKMTFMPDGKMMREPLGKAGGPGEGTWKLSGDGFCTTWKGAKQNCFRLVAGEGKWSVMSGTTAQAIWTK